MIVYMQVPGIQGTGGGSKSGWIWVEKCTLGLERDAETSVDDESGAPNKKPRLLAFSLWKDPDSTTPPLLSWLKQGDAREVVFEFRVNKDQLAARATLSNARMTSYRAYCRSGAEDIVEQIGIDYTKIAIDYTAYNEGQRSAASLDFSYDSEA